jgi:hypothetical protein
MHAPQTEKLPKATKSDAAVEERRFLQGPHSRFEELQRALRIFRELIHEFRHLHFVGPCVTVFGSARFPESHPYYELGKRVARSLPRWALR